jgi:drug/metabolite transporter (DMT)-like permease
VKSTDDSLGGLCSSPQRDKRNGVLILLWAFAWGFSFVAVAHGIKKEWLSFGMTLAGVIVNALLGLATVLAYRRFLQETDELRRKIEVEALALAFGVGVVGGLTYWLLR